MLRRIDKLAQLGTTLVTINGGETLLHPHLGDIIRRISFHGMISGLITDGYLLQQIERLNEGDVPIQFSHFQL
jgi:MoaA/NifB/PqqE/SkfB family radical SAM enzyme